MSSSDIMLENQRKKSNFVHFEVGIVKKILNVVAETVLFGIRNSYQQQCLKDHKINFHSITVRFHLSSQQKNQQDNKKIFFFDPLTKDRQLTSEFLDARSDLLSKRERERERKLDCFGFQFKIKCNYVRICDYPLCN